MPRSDFDAAAYLNDLFADLPQEEAETAKKVLMNEVVSNRLADSVLRQNDYKKQTAELRKREEALAKQDQQITEFYNRQLAIVQENQKYVDQLEKRASSAEQAMKAYQQQYGELEGVPMVPAQTNQSKDYYTRDEVKQILDTMQRDGLNVMKIFTSLGTRHFAEFKEPLDTDALERIASEQRVDLNTAYERMVADRRDAVRQQEMEKKLKEAREEGRKEALSTAKLPYLPTSSDISPLRAREALTDDQMKVPAWKRGLADFVAGKLGSADA